MEPSEAFVELALAAERLPPEQVGSLVDRCARMLGAEGAAVYLADLEQLVLTKLPGGSVRGRAVLSIQGTMPGRAFMKQTSMRSSHGERGVGSLWIPILDSSERVGVMKLVATAEDEQTIRIYRAFASLVGELVMSKRRYGDFIELARRRSELDIAAEMRWSLAPPLSYVSESVSVAGAWEPAYEIAGDAFDFAPNAGMLHLALIDAMGHSLEASRMANVAIGAYRNCRRRGFGLEQTFGVMDHAIGISFGEDRFVTGQLAVLDVGSGELRSINAGHPRPMLIRGRREIGDLPAAPSPPFGLGVVPSESADVFLEPGDLVLFFTDGITEARSSEGEEYGRTRLGDHASRHAASGLPIAEIARRLIRSVLEHQDGKMRDDATILLVRWSGPAAGDADHQERRG